MKPSGESFLSESRRPFNQAMLTRKLTAPVGPLSRVTLVATTASTNADIADGLRAGASWPHLSALVAEWQPEGRGRVGREWVTPEGTSVTASFVVRHDGFPPEELGWIPLMAGLAVVRALRRDGMSARIKWPNDVVVDDAAHPRLPGWGMDRKVAGILCEVVGDAVVVGIGINVSQEESELPVASATSLALAGSGNLDRAEILGGVARELALALATWRSEGGPAQITREVSAACGTIGKAVVIERPGHSAVSGVAVRLSPVGGLVLEITKGQFETVVAGDVLLRSL